MTDIHAFIEARLAEDEAAAAATTPVPVAGKWRPSRDKHAEGEAPLRLVQGVDPYEGEEWNQAGPCDYVGTPIIAFSAQWQHEAEANLRHITRHDPARVLLEVEAKRRRLKLHTPEQVAYIDQNRIQQAGLVCAVCGDDGETPGALWPCDTVKTDALPYAGHPDFKPQWALA